MKTPSDADIRELAAGLVAAKPPKAPPFQKKGKPPAKGGGLDIGTARKMLAKAAGTPDEARVKRTVYKAFPQLSSK